MPLATLGSMILGIITLACGVLIIVFPKLLSWLVGAYPVIIGLAIILSSL